jgi:hypothetical protein
MQLYQRPLTFGMRLAAWATATHAGCELLLLLVMIRQSAPGLAFLAGMGVEIGATVILGLLMFHGVVISYFVMGVYGILRLLIGGLAGYAIATGEVERVDPLLIMGMLIATPFALGWITGVVAVWQARQRSAHTLKSAARAV